MQWAPLFPCVDLQVAALIKSMALKEASMAPPCEPVCVSQEEDPALKFYRDDGELWPHSPPRQSHSKAQTTPIFGTCCGDHRLTCPRFVASHRLACTVLSYSGSEVLRCWSVHKRKYSVTRINILESACTLHRVRIWSVSLKHCLAW